jgi:phage protein U
MLTSLTMMALGTFRFGVNQASYQSLRRSATYRWAQASRAGRAPASQFIGPGGEEMTLDGVIYPHFKGGLRQVEGMRAVAGLGQPMMLVDGLGWVLQRWCIAGVDETRSVFLADGAPRRIDFSLRLVSYGEDAQWRLF